MAASDQAEVERRAKALWEKDGYATRTDFYQASERRTPLLGRVLLSEEKRQVFLERARAELGATGGENA